MAEKYAWAINKSKLQRALANVEAKVGPKWKEEDVKKIYISYGGLVDKINDTISNPESDSTIEEE